MISHIEANELLDLYGALLTARQQEILSLYFQEDLTLSEIQENLKISKAAVHDTLKKAIAAMEQYEAVLQLRRKKTLLQAYIQAHPESAEELELLF